MLVPARRHDAEWMDRPDNTFEDLDAALRDIAWANRRLGGRRALLRGLEPCGMALHAIPGPARVTRVTSTAKSELPKEMQKDRRNRRGE